MENPLEGYALSSSELKTYRYGLKMATAPSCAWTCSQCRQHLRQTAMAKCRQLQRAGFLQS